MNNYNPHPETHKGIFRKIIPITALRKRVTSTLVGRTGSFPFIKVRSFLNNILPSRRHAQLVEIVTSCQAQLRDLSLAVEKTSIELNQTRELLEGYVRQCSLHCSNFEYVPGDPAKEVPVLTPEDSDESSILRAISPVPTRTPTTKVVVRSPSTSVRSNDHHHEHS